MKHDQRTVETVYALEWHFEAKRLALRNALKFRCPLSPTAQNELRLYYPEYFAHLLSATEMLREADYPHSQSFISSLERRFVFEGRPDGASNYAFVRELRNAVIHRGLNINAAAHVEADFPLLVAPSSLTNRSGSKTQLGFGHYLLEVIGKCEAVVGPVIADHLIEFGSKYRLLCETPAARTPKHRSLDILHIGM